MRVAVRFGMLLAGCMDRREANERLCWMFEDMKCRCAS